MSHPVPTRTEAIERLRRQFSDDHDPRLTINEVAVLVDFHRRTLQRYVDEGLIAAEKIGPKHRTFIRWSKVREMFPEDTRRILAKMDKDASGALSNL